MDRVFNYADYINDRVRLIQRLVEGTKGWQDDLRKRAADAYTYAYGAVGTSLRGTANNFDVAPSTAYDYKKAWKEYQKAEKELSCKGGGNFAPRDGQKLREGVLQHHERLP